MFGSGRFYHGPVHFQLDIARQQDLQQFVRRFLIDVVDNLRIFWHLGWENAAQLDLARYNSLEVVRDDVHRVELLLRESVDYRPGNLEGLIVFDGAQKEG